MNILITGGSRGIGRACVERFAADGHTVHFLYHKSHEVAQELAKKTGATAHCTDVADPNAVRETIRRIAAGGSIDVLVNNAGISQIGLCTDVSDEEWHRMLETNLSGAFYAARAVIPDMVRKQFGRIINVGSMWGKTGASCEVPYSSAKAGLRGMTMAMAKELGPSGITVNCIEPGLIMTDMNASLDEDAIAAICDETPLCRAGKPEEVAALVAFLASNEAGFITGQCIGIDGGLAV